MKSWNQIGDNVKIDELTSIHSGAKFARICIVIDLRRKLIPTFTALGKDFLVAYERLHLVCFNCGKYGHKLEECPTNGGMIENNSGATMTWDITGVSSSWEEF